MKELTIGRNDAGQRLDRFLAKAVPLLPASLAQKYIRLKRVKLNGKRTERDTRLTAGDTEARVVHHQVDAALRRHHLIHGGAQRLLPGDVRHDVGDVRHAFRPAAQLIDGPAALPQGQRRGAADPGGASGDDSDFFIHGASPSRPQ